MATPSLTCVSMWTSHLSSNHRVSIPINWNKNIIFFSQNGIQRKLMNKNSSIFRRKLSLQQLQQNSFTNIPSLQQYSAKKGSETSNCHCNSIIRLSKFLSRNKGETIKELHVMYFKRTSVSETPINHCNWICRGHSLQKESETQPRDITRVRTYLQETTIFNSVKPSRG